VIAQVFSGNPFFWGGSNRVILGIDANPVRSHDAILRGWGRSCVERATDAREIAGMNSLELAAERHLV
jgi:hypothetical protein